MTMPLACDGRTQSQGQGAYNTIGPRPVWFEGLSSPASRTSNSNQPSGVLTEKCVIGIGIAGWLQCCDVAPASLAVAAATRSAIKDKVRSRSCTPLIVEWDPSAAPRTCHHSGKKVSVIMSPPAISTLYGTKGESTHPNEHNT